MVATRDFYDSSDLLNYLLVCLQLQSGFAVGMPRAAGSGFAVGLPHIAACIHGN